MKTLNGKIDGPYVVTEDTNLVGMITDKAIVPSGVHFEVTGMITGDLEVHSGASVLIRGMVNGLVENKGGQIVIEGWVDEVVETDPRASTQLRGDGRVRGKWGGSVRNG